MVNDQIETKGQMMEVESILRAMKAHDIPPGESGLWRITGMLFTEADCEMFKRAKSRDVMPGAHRFLRRYTDSTLHGGGEVVMEDSLHELRTHLEFVLKARGRVLVTGLGLGCVVRGLLTRDAVESIDVVEISQDVLKLVEPHMPRDPRLTIHHADAFEFIGNTDARWDSVWHDIWTDTDSGEPHLQVAHMQLMCALIGRAGLQGAWALPRNHRRALRRRQGRRTEFI